MGSLPINPFDAAVATLTLLVAIIAGFRSGLLRSLATIFGYVVAAPVAVAAAPYLIADPGHGQFHLTPDAELAGAVRRLCRHRHGAERAAAVAVSEMAGPDVSIARPRRRRDARRGAHRTAGGAMVLIFDRIIPAGREPAFLVGLAAAADVVASRPAGLKSLPPDVANYIDRLKRERGI